MAMPDVDLCDAALREHAAYLDLLREIGRHGAAAAQTLATAYTASSGGQRRAVLTTLAEQMTTATTAISEALAALDHRTTS